MKLVKCTTESPATMAAKLVKQAPAYCHINKVLMTAQKGASTADVIRLFESRKRR